MAHNNLGNALTRAGRPREGEQAYRRGAALFERLTAEQPDVPRCQEGLATSRRNLADLLWDAGRRPEAAEAYGRARAAYEKLVAHNPGVPTFARGLAVLLADCPDPAFRDVQRAAGLAQRAVDRAPRDGACWAALGVARYRAGEWPAALRALGQARELAGDNPALSFYLAMAHGRLGEQDQAREWYDRACAALGEDRPVGKRLLPLRAEAAALLGLPPPAEPPGKGASRPGGQPSPASGAPTRPRPAAPSPPGPG
jgi:tetratricopeptide (TPR) repeat protein